MNETYKNPALQEEPIGESASILAFVGEHYRHSSSETIQFKSEALVKLVD